MTAIDTSPEIAAKQIELIRTLSLERKLELTSAFSWNLIRAIERCGGALRDSYHLEEHGTDVNRYWVPVTVT